MHKFIKTLSLSIMALASASLTSAAIAADDYPTKPIRFIVAFAPGGPVDVMARVVAQKLLETLRQPVVVENRAGAGGNIGSALVARSAPDGYTILVQSSAFAVNPTLYKNPGYDAIKEFVPIINGGLVPNLIFAHPSLPANTLPELIGLAKKEKMSYASSGIGSTPHLTGELLLKTLSGLDITHVPYNGGGPAVTAVVSGQVLVGSAALIAPMPMVKAGKLKAIVVTSLQRAPQLPDVPTVAESGYPGYEDYTWVGFLAPAGTPKSIVDRLNREIALVLHRPDVKEILSGLGFESKPNTPEEFAAFLKVEITKWGKVVKAAGALVD
jgi:tripartite-type tricarboxylate transporter receptor subunit TctC